MTIKADNSPDLRWVGFIVLYIMCQFIYLLDRGDFLKWLLILSGISLSAVVIALMMRITIVFDQTSFVIYFKIGAIPYWKISRTFSKITVDSETIRFIKNEDEIFNLDVSLAVEEDEASVITLWAKGKYSHLGNRKNCLQLFDTIKTYYQTGI